MAKGISTTLAESLLQLFSGSAVTAEATYKLQLTSDPPDIDGNATVLTSGVAPGYADVVLNCDSSTWQFVNARKIQNKEHIFFPAASTGDWTKSAQGWLLATSDDVVHFYGHMHNGRLIRQGERFKILPGGLTIEIRSPLVSEAFASDILGLLQGNNITAMSNFTLHFGVKDPSQDGQISELVGNNYQPLTIAANTTNIEVPVVGSGQIRNLVEFDHTHLWEPTADIPKIVSGEIRRSDGTPMLRGNFTEAMSLRAGDNLRLPINSLRLYRQAS